jgi:myo-inositol 2-dehydrogenase / D-chiro-inositol 1-dehydrogenase
MPQTKIGVVGAGYIAGRHVATLTAVPDTAVVAVCDPQRDRATSLAARCGARAYADYAAMLAETPLDGVYICLPPAAHGGPERAALRRNLPIFVEKPLAADLATAEELAADIAAAGVPTATGYHWRYLDTVELLGELLADRPPAMVIGSWLDRMPGTPWWASRSASGGQLVEQATHLFDLARLLVGEVESVSAVGARAASGAGDIDHVTAATLRFRSGAVGSVASTCLLRRGWRIALEVVADGLAAAVTEHELTVDDGTSVRVVPVGVDPLLREDTDFVAAVRGEPVLPRAPYAEALATHRVAVAAAASAASGRAVALDGAAR